MTVERVAPLYLATCKHCAEPIENTAWNAPDWRHADTRQAACAIEDPVDSDLWSFVAEPDGDPECAW